MAADLRSGPGGGMYEGLGSSSNNDSVPAMTAHKAAGDAEKQAGANTRRRAPGTAPKSGYAP